jgi:hypothetical protein
MRYRMFGIWGALLCSQMGCYESHGSDVDGSAPPVFFDVGPPPDGALPPEPEPRPDEPPPPPIDVPPPVGPDEPALVPVGDPVALDDESDGGGPPLLVWNDVGWGVVWGFVSPLRLEILDASGHPVGVASEPTRDRWGVLGAGLDFAEGRYALVLGSGRAASFDRNALRVAGWSPVESGDESDVARLSVDRRWVVVQSVDGAGHAVRAYELEDDMTTVAGPAIELGEDGVGDVRIGGAKTRALAVWTTRSRVMGRVLRGRPFEPVGAAIEIFDSGGYEDSASTVELFGDRFAVVALRGGDVRLRFVDPFGAVRLDSEPVVVGSRGLTDRRPAIATAPERGFVAACWGTGRGGGGGGDSEDGVALQVIGSDGSHWGAPLQLISGERNIGGVSCGWNGSEIVVVWWRAAGDGAYNAIFSQRVRPTFL